MRVVIFEGLEQGIFIAGTNTVIKVPAVDGETIDFRIESFKKNVQDNSENEMP